MPGHDTEKCWRLKNAMQELIDNRRIEVQAPEAPNINQNPLPAHHEANMIELLYKGAEPKKPSQTVMMIRSIEAKEEENVVRVKPTAQPKWGNDKPVVVIGKGSSVVTKKPEPAELVVPGASSAPVAIVKGAYIEPVVIKPEESCEAQGLTRSGRCFALEELRKARVTKDNPLLVKKAVTEEEAKEFLKKMKVQDYSIVEQLRKMVIFSDDELPVEGTEHNKALYLTVKCEDSVVTRVLIDNGSSANICPLSTLNKLRIDDDRIHKNSVCIRGFDGGGTDTVGDIIFELTIGPIEFTMEFQVLDIAVSYKILLGRPWIHATKAVPSTLHQMVKFEWDRQEVVLHGEDHTCTVSDAIVPFIDTDDDKGPWVYQVFDTITVDKVPKGKSIPRPRVASATAMVVSEMLSNGFVLGKGLGAELQGVVQPVSLPKNLDTFGLRFKPTTTDVRRAHKLKKKAWVLSKPIPCLSRSFVRPDVRKQLLAKVSGSLIGAE
ncbi:uncharacterized protein [Nicotiana sylvestris]|uniref:uncharacterized protein n=1 Tax=Nicotiana sylvestris TaxID=4096 RepID=UPI00388C6DE1